jgi:hypothetical protein
MQSDRPLVTQRLRKTYSFAIAACLAVSLAPRTSRADSTDAYAGETQSQGSAKKTAGIVLAAIGAAVLVGGIATTVSAAACKQNCSSIQGVVGKGLIGGSLPFFIIGVPLWLTSTDDTTANFNARAVPPLNQFNLGFRYRMSF